MMITSHGSKLLSALSSADIEKEAVVFNARRISYGELQDSVSRTMTFLIDKGVSKGDRVAIWLNKSPESIFLLLATMGVGAAYVPIDPGAPKARVITLLDDCEPVLLFASELNCGQLNAGRGHAVESIGLKGTDSGFELEKFISNLQPSQAQKVSTDDLAAILYTSGSTGTPKGVMLSHGNISNFVAWAVEAFGLLQKDRFTSHAPFHFDLSTFDLFAAFHVGGTVCLLDEISVRFPGTILKFLREECITVWYSVPTALRLLVMHEMTATEQLKQLRLVLFAGEVFQPSALRAVMEAFSQARFFNLYGPTETNVCTYYEVPRPLPPEILSVPIGFSCPPLEAGVYDELGQRLPSGSTGEICVTGPGVMLGYWKHGKLTAQKRLNGRKHSYRTGDYGFQMDDGNIMFTGRRDNQVKFRGHRIELLEIEAIISSHTDISEGVAIISQDGRGEQLLHVFVTAQAGSTKPGKMELVRYIASKLPAYCVPDDIFWLETMPRTSTGKVDRNRLRQL